MSDGVVVWPDPQPRSAANVAFVATVALLLRRPLPGRRESLAVVEAYPSGPIHLVSPRYLDDRVPTAIVRIQDAVSSPCRHCSQKHCCERRLCARLPGTGRTKSSKPMKTHLHVHKQYVTLDQKCATHWALV